MSQHNPFAVGEHAGSGQSARIEDPTMHPAFRELIQLLVETRPWVRFLGILSTIGTVILIIIGAVATLFFSRMGAGFAGVIYFLMAFLYIYPSICLLKFASAISAAEHNGQMLSVNEAILHQKKFWRFCGIVAAVIVAVYVLILVIPLGLMLIA